MLSPGLQVAILAGGLATRLRPLAEKIPKSMIRIGGKPFLEYQIDLLKRKGIRDIVLCIGYLGDQIKEYFEDGKRFGVQIQYSHESSRLLGTAGALKKAEELLKDEFFVMYGDSYLFLNFQAIASYFHQFDKQALMVVYKNYDRYDNSNIAIEGNLVKQYSKKEKTKEMIYIDYGVSMLRKMVLDLVPQNIPYPLEELFSKLISQKEVLAYEVKKRFYEVGSQKGLVEFQGYLERRRRYDHNKNSRKNLPRWWGN